MATRTDTGILTLAQWLSPAYPLGSYAYSHGLEAAVAAGDVSGSAGLREWLADILRHGAGRSDALFLAAAYKAETEDALREVDRLCRAFAVSAERLREAELQGAAFCEVTSRVWGLDLPRLAFPVGVGRAARLEGLPPVTTAALYLQAFLGNLVAAAQRLLPLGQTDAQRLISAHAPLCRAIAEQTRAGAFEMLSGTAFLADIRSMNHETQRCRIFRT